jgi:hypothetical protein
LIGDPFFRVEDWNEAFNYSSNLGFVQQCLADTKGAPNTLRIPSRLLD